MRAMMTGWVVLTLVCWATAARAGLSPEAQKVQARAEALRADAGAVLNAKHASKAAADQAVADLERRQRELDRDLASVEGKLHLDSSKAIQTRTETRFDPVSGTLQSRSVVTKELTWSKAVRVNDSVSGSVTYQTKVPPPDVDLRARFEGRSSAGGRTTTTQVTSIRPNARDEVVEVEVTSTTR